MFISGYVLGLPLDHPWLSMFYILLFAGTIASFVSHTVASIILMPIISRIGASLDMPEVIVMGSAFAGVYIVYVIGMC